MPVPLVRPRAARWAAPTIARLASVTTKQRRATARCFRHSDALRRSISVREPEAAVLLVEGEKVREQLWDVRRMQLAGQCFEAHCTPGSLAIAAFVHAPAPVNARAPPPAHQRRPAPAVSLQQKRSGQQVQRHDEIHAVDCRRCLRIIH